MLSLRLSTINYSKIYNLTKSQVPILNSLCKNDFNSWAPTNNKKPIIGALENDHSGLTKPWTTTPISPSASLIIQRYYSVPVKKSLPDKDVEETKKILIRYTFKTIAFLWDVSKLVIHYTMIVVRKIYNSHLVQRYVQDFKKKLEEAKKN